MKSSSVTAKGIISSCRWCSMQGSDLEKKKQKSLNKFFVKRRM